VVLWNGEEIALPSAKPSVKAHIRDRAAFYGLVRNPSLHFGDLYSVDRVEVEGDLVEFLIAVYDGMGDKGRQSSLRRLHKVLTPRPRSNTLDDSRANINHHYDIGNSFYELWLDRE
jgi:cyclopropane-fatty-acyl-phospholipid synthase